ncbi:MAG: O-antigen ligase family protein [Patescibacteria group bacterium]
MRWIKLLLFLLLLLLPTQLGKHFWPDLAIVSGRRVDYLSPTLYVTDLLVLVIAGALMSNKVRNKTVRLIIVGTTVFLGIAAFWLSSNTLWFPWFTIFMLAVFGLVVQRFPLTLAMCLFPLGIGACLQSFIAVAQFLSQRSVGGWLYWLGERSFSSLTPGVAQLALETGLYLRPYGTLPHPNVLGGYLTVVFSLFLFLPKKTYKSKILVLLRNTVLTMCALGIAISFSRLAWVGLVVLIFVRLLKEEKRTSARIQLVLLIFLALFVEELTIGRIMSVVSLDTVSFTERITQYEEGARMLLDHPFLGIGVGGYLRKAHFYATPPFLFQPIHSIFMLIALEAGFVGLSIFAVACLYALRTSWKQQRWWSFAGLATILFLGLFDHYMITIHQTQTLFVLVWINAVGWVHTT